MTINIIQNMINPKSYFSCFAVHTREIKSSANNGAHLWVLI